MGYLNLSKLSLPTRETDPNWWADHIEFLCLLSQDYLVTLQQVSDRLLDENTNVATAAYENILEEEEAEEWADEIENESEFDGEDKDEDVLAENVALDSINPRVRSYFDILRQRQEIYGSAYPFKVSDKWIEIDRHLSDSQYLYIVLLCSSLLGFTTPAGANKFGHWFESLCEPVFCKLVPPNSKVCFFGAGRDGIKEFPGTFYEKVKKLAEMLHLELSADFIPENVPKTNVGDGGLDWIGFFEFDDKQKYLPKFFGQCACGKDWVDKQADAVVDRWGNYIQLDNAYLVYHFIPRSFRLNLYKWANPLHVRRVTLIDRLRIIQLLGGNGKLHHLILDIYSPFLEELSSSKIDPFA